jgi:hypothetical protein
MYTTSYFAVALLISPFLIQAVPLGGSKGDLDIAIKSYEKAFRNHPKNAAKIDKLHTSCRKKCKKNYDKVMETQPNAQGVRDARTKRDNCDHKCDSDWPPLPEPNMADWHLEVKGGRYVFVSGGSFPRTVH